MFTFYRVAPRLDCYIDNDKLKVSHPFGEADLEYDLKPTSFIRERKIIRDVRRVTTGYKQNAFAIGTEDGYTILGNLDGKYMVLTPEGFVYNIGTWNVRPILPPETQVGIHDDYKIKREVLVSPNIKGLLHVPGTSYYAKVNDSIYEALLNNSEFSTEMSASKAHIANGFDKDTYFILNGGPDEFIEQKFKEDLNSFEYVNSNIISTNNCFWRYNKDSEVHAIYYDMKGQIGPFDTHLVFDTEHKRFKQTILPEYALAFLYKNPDAIAAYVANDEAIHVIFPNLLRSYVIHVECNYELFLYKTYDRELDEIPLPMLTHVGYKATKPLFPGNTPTIIKVFCDSSGAIVDEDVTFKKPALKPPVSLYKHIIENKATYGYIDSVTGNEVFI